VKRERIDGRREKEKEALANLKREKAEEEMRYFWIKPNKYPFHMQLPLCPCLKRVLKRL
jgi:hypothetical protein